MLRLFVTSEMVSFTFSLAIHVGCPVLIFSRSFVIDESLKSSTPRQRIVETIVWMLRVNFSV